MLFSKRARLSAMVAAMRGPRKRRSPAAWHRDRASIILTSKLNNSSRFQDSPHGQVYQAHWQRLGDVTARIVERLRRQRARAAT